MNIASNTIKLYHVNVVREGEKASLVIVKANHVEGT